MLLCASAAKFNRPIQAMGPHTAGLGLRFYNWREGANFPKEWHRKLFVAQRGSWNRQLKIGYRWVCRQGNPSCLNIAVSGMH